MGGDAAGDCNGQDWLGIGRQGETFERLITRQEKVLGSGHPDVKGVKKEVRAG